MIVVFVVVMPVVVMVNMFLLNLQLSQVMRIVF